MLSGMWMICLQLFEGVFLRLGAISIETVVIILISSFLKRKL